MTTALEVVSGQQHTPAVFYPRKILGLPLYRRLGGPQRRSAWAEKLAPPEFDPRSALPVVILYTDWATRPTRFNEAIYKTLTKITASHQVQTEDVRKFTGSTGLAFSPSATAVTDCVELDCIGLGANFIDTIESIWQNMKLNIALQHKT